MDFLRQRTELTLKGWLAGYELPSPQDPLFAVEVANLDLLNFFFATLAIASDPAPPTATLALQRFLPEHGAILTHCRPSKVLQQLGLGREKGLVYELQERLQEGFSPEQRALLLILSGES